MRLLQDVTITSLNRWSLAWSPQASLSFYPDTLWWILSLCASTHTGHSAWECREGLNGGRVSSDGQAGCRPIPTKEVEFDAGSADGCVW